MLHKPTARAAYTAQVSAASVGHIPHLVPHSPPIADIAGRALTIVDPIWHKSSSSRSEVAPLSLYFGFGFASPFFLSFPLSFALIASLKLPIAALQTS